MYLIDWATYLAVSNHPLRRSAGVPLRTEPHPRMCGDLHQPVEWWYCGSPLWLWHGVAPGSGDDGPQAVKGRVLSWEEAVIKHPSVHTKHSVAGRPRSTSSGLDHNPPAADSSTAGAGVVVLVPAGYDWHPERMPGSHKLRQR